jgi:hypothetical protein
LLNLAAPYGASENGFAGMCELPQGPVVAVATKLRGFRVGQFVHDDIEMRDLRLIVEHVIGWRDMQDWERAKVEARAREMGEREEKEMPELVKVGVPVPVPVGWFGEAGG